MVIRAFRARILARTSAFGKGFGMFLEPFFGFPDWTRQIRVENRRSHKLRRTSSVAETLNGGLGMTRKVDLQDLPLQLVQVHVINRVLGVLWRAERNKREPSVVSTWEVARLVFFFGRRDGLESGRTLLLRRVCRRGWQLDIDYVPCGDRVSVLWWNAWKMPSTKS